MTISVFTRPVGGLLENDIRGNDNAIRVVVNGILDNYLTGPVSSTDNAIVRWDGTTGRVAQNSAVTIDDNGVLTVTSTQSVQQVVRYDANHRVDVGVSSAGVVTVTVVGDDTPRFVLAGTVDVAPAGDAGVVEVGHTITANGANNAVAVRIRPTMNFSANFGQNVGLMVHPSFVVGSYTDTTTIGLWVVGSSSGATNYSIYSSVSAARMYHVGEAGIAVAPAASTALNLAASTTARSSIRLAHGAAPTSPVNGDMWTTNAGLYVRINGATVGPLS